MPWPFTKARETPQAPSRGTIETIYGMIVAQAREPVFYQDLRVPDTVNGRFDLLVLHLWMLMRRLRATKDQPALAQALFDKFCADMDDNLREMGVSDTTVPKRMKAFGEAFYGRGLAYDAALAEGDEALRDALGRNVLNTDNAPAAAALAAYVRDAIAALDAQLPDDIAAGRLRFPALTNESGT